MIAREVQSPPAASGNGQTDSLAERLLVSGADAATLCGLSARTWRPLDLIGQIPRARRFSGSKRWSVAELRNWVAAGCPARERWEQMAKAAK